jgi:Putative peptidoglycan binding domain
MKESFIEEIRTHLRLFARIHNAMNYLTSFRTVAVAGLIFAAPAIGMSKDQHGSGNWNHNSGNWNHNSGNWNHGSRAYYAPYYGYRPYYGGGYGYRAYPYFRPSVSFGFYSAPAYYDTPDYDYDSYSTRPIYRGVVRPDYGYRGGSYNDDLAVDVQRALARRGFYRGAIDGDVGPGTRAAIRSFQYNRGLTVTGRIDGSLLRSLGLS